MGRSSLAPSLVSPPSASADPLWARIAAHDFEAADQTPNFLQRLARDKAWTPAFARGAIAEYRRFAYLCVHGATHAWSRLKWLADLGGLLAAEDDEGRTRLYRGACDLGAGRCPASALLLCEALLGIALPRDFARAIRGDAGARRLASLALEAMAGGGGAELDERRFFNDRIVLSQLLFARGWRFRIAEATRQSVSVNDRMTLRLPPALGFIYLLVRVPLWFWRRLGRRDGFRRS